MPRVRKTQAVNKPERPPRPRLIHFDSGRIWHRRDGVPDSERTYCGAKMDGAPDTDTILDKVTCARCKTIRAKELRPKMKVIRVSYRAEFVGLKQGPLNPIGAVVKVPISIECFESSLGTWKFRAPHNRAEIPELGTAPGLQSAQRQAASQFEKLSSPWVMIGDAGDGQGRRELRPEEVVIKAGKVYVYETDEEREKVKAEHK